VPNLIPQERVESKILLIRGEKTILDRDLGILTNTKPSLLNTMLDFPFEDKKDYVFSLNKKEKARYGLPLNRKVIAYTIKYFRLIHTLKTAKTSSELESALMWEAIIKTFDSVPLENK
jgi:hypothetical protein